MTSKIYPLEDIMCFTLWDLPEESTIFMIFVIPFAILLLKLKSLIYITRFYSARRRRMDPGNFRSSFVFDNLTFST